MTLWQKLDMSERIAAVQSTAASKNIEDRAVEKDWWVTAVLKALFTTSCSDYLLLIIAKKRYGLVPSLHSISNSIGQVLFRRSDIRELYNQPTLPVNVPEAGAVEQLTLW